MNEGKRTGISKQMAYLLRHEPSGLEVDDDGFVDLYRLLDKLHDRWSGLTTDDVREVVERDPKGRYEIKGERVRARYGHSIDVNPDLSPADVDVLYHGTTKKAAESILDEGLKSKGRQKVHLSRTVEEAINVGKRRTSNPVVLKVNARDARKAGIKIERASDRVFVSEDIPPEFVSPHQERDP